MTILLKINPWTGREVALEEAEKVKQEELGTKDELFAVDLVGYDEDIDECLDHDDDICRHVSARVCLYCDMWRSSL